MNIKIKNLAFAHDKTQALNNIRLSLDKGMLYSLLGPNGSGKTTFLDLISGFLKPVAGEILFDDLNINSFSRKELSKIVAVVSQDYYINFPYTVREVVAMGRHPYTGRFSSLDQNDIDIIERVAEDTEITGFMDRKITCLSGGERQRVVFARALCQEAPVLLLDEAFSNLDINHSINLLRVLKKQIQTKEIIVIAVFHDINFASIWSDCMIFLKKGRIISSGSPEKVMSEDIIKKVYNIDVKVEHNKFAQARQVYFKTS